MRKCYTIDLNELNKATGGVFSTVEHLLSVDQVYKPFKYSSLKLDPAGFLTYPTHTGSGRVKLGNYMYDKKDAVCVLETSRVTSESLVIADFSECGLLAGDQDKKFNFNRILNMYRAGREPLSELSLFLGGHVDNFIKSWDNYPRIDGRDINIWIHQLQHFCDDLKLLYGVDKRVPLLEILNSLLIRTHSAEDRDAVMNKMTKSRKGTTKYKVEEHSFPDIRELWVNFVDEVLEELSLKRIQDDSILLSIVDVVQLLSRRPDLIEQCVFEKNGADSLRFHRNDKLVMHTSVMTNYKLERMRSPNVLNLFFPSESSRYKFVADNRLDSLMTKFTFVQDISYIDKNSPELRNPLIRLIEEEVYSGDCKVSYVNHSDQGYIDLYPVAIDTLLGRFGKTIDCFKDYENLGFALCKLDESRIIVLTDKESRDLCLICPMWRYNLNEYMHSIDDPFTVAKYSDTRDSKYTTYKLSTESVKSFFKVMERGML